MNESMWGAFFIVVGIFSIIFLSWFQDATTTDEQNYYLVKEATESAMHDAIDLSHYRQTGEIKIIEEKFVENFTRRFAQSAKTNKEYVIKFYDIQEYPPKVSLAVGGNVTGFSVEGNILGEFEVINSLDAILETKVKGIANPSLLTPEEYDRRIKPEFDHNGRIEEGLTKICFSRTDNKQGVKIVENEIRVTANGKEAKVIIIEEGERWCTEEEFYGTEVEYIIEIPYEYNGERQPSVILEGILEYKPGIGFVPDGDLVVRKEHGSMAIIPFNEAVNQNSLEYVWQRNGNVPSVFGNKFNNGDVQRISINTQASGDWYLCARYYTNDEVPKEVKGCSKVFKLGNGGVACSELFTIENNLDSETQRILTGSVRAIPGKSIKRIKYCIDTSNTCDPNIPQVGATFTYVIPENVYTVYIRAKAEDENDEMCNGIVSKRVERVKPKLVCKAETDEPKLGTKVLIRAEDQYGSPVEANYTLSGHANFKLVEPESNGGKNIRQIKVDVPSSIGAGKNLTVTVEKEGYESATCSLTSKSSSSGGSSGGNNLCTERYNVKICCVMNESEMGYEFGQPIIEKNWKCTTNTTNDTPLCHCLSDSCTVRPTSVTSYVRITAGGMTLKGSASSVSRVWDSETNTYKEIITCNTSVNTYKPPVR